MSKVYKRKKVDLEVYRSILYILWMSAFFLAFLDVKLTYECLSSLTVDESVKYKFELSIWVSPVIKYFGVKNAMLLILFSETLFLTFIFVLPLEGKRDFMLRVIIFLMVISNHLIGIAGWSRWVFCTT